VIVGKQSVGKSSLLESLTEIPFPVGDELCTRFATRVISRRTAPGTPDMIKVSIEEGDVDPFGDSKCDGQTGHLELPEDPKSMTAEYFRELMDKVRQKCFLEAAYC
jgi:GTPase SAR1 family protein